MITHTTEQRGVSIRPSTIRKMEAIIKWFKERASFKPINLAEAANKTRELECSALYMSLLVKSGFARYTDGQYTLNRQMNYDEAVVLAELKKLYVKQSSVAIEKQRKAREALREKEASASAGALASTGTPSAPEEPYPPIRPDNRGDRPNRANLMSISNILSKVPDNKLIEEVQRRGYLVFSE